MNQMPSIFISHGPPGIAVFATPAGDFLKSLGERLPRPQAILSISAHWETLWPQVTSAPIPTIIYDFGGPPKALKLAYSPQGDPAVAARVVTILQENGYRAESESVRGLDHGTWIPLLMMYPDADVPVVQLSLQTEETSEYLYKLGGSLSELPSEGVLVMASGGAVHNLHEVDQYGIDAPPPDYVKAFDCWLEKMVNSGDVENLLQFKTNGPNAERCHPYPAEHFLPLFVALGAKNGARGRTLHKSFMFGTLSMAAYAWY
jgi:4,5-DOPA dioxygenase extradiol